MMLDLNTRQQGVRSGRGRRMNDAAAQQRALSAMGVEVTLTVLKTLPPGGWLRFVPEGEPIRTAPRRILED